MAGAATAVNRSWFQGRRSNSASVRRPTRALTAAATRLDLGNRTEARRQRALRQGWQLEAWAYRDSIGELRYAVNFLANCMARMKVYPAAYAEGETDEPVPLSVEMGAPAELVAACEQAMKDLGNGKMAIAGLLHSLSTNISVPGEGFLLGQEDPETGQQRWSIRSIDEVIVYNDSYKLREVPMDPQGILGWVDLDPALTIVSRMWQPHPRFRILADSPLRAIMDDCESLLMLRRMIRSTARSRLAGRGMLLIPDELSIAVPQDDNDDPQADPFLDELTRHMIEPIADEGMAAGVVPITVRGPGDTLAQVRLVEFASKFDEMASATRAELVGIIATGFDLPKEIITGVADLNHWSAWQVDDNTFRHHVEPHVITGMDCLTSAYLRPYIQSCDLDPAVIAAWSERVLMWYDPTELVTNPNQAADALQLHDRKAISNEALRRITGFNESDAPSTEEFTARLISDMRTWPANAVAEILHQIDPTLSFPPITVAGTVPGVKPGPGGGVDVGEAPAPAAPASSGTPPVPSQASDGPPAPVAPDTPTGPPPPAQPPPPSPAVTAAGGPRSKKLDRLSKRLASIDRDLRARLQTAANAALLRQLEKAGGRLRSKVAKDETLRAKIALTRNEHVASVLGKDAVEATGLTASSLMDSDFTTLREQFYSWTASAQQQALATAQQMAGLDEGDEAMATAAAAMATGREAAWTLLDRALSQLAEHALYSPVPGETVDIASMNPDTLVPTGVIRAALGVAGGATEQDFGLVTTNTGASVPAVPLGAGIGQVGTGSTITDLLTSQPELSQVGFTWEHGSTIHAFEPHEELDGAEFSSWDDDVLANNGDFPNNAFFMPGDHAGCTCDFTAIWSGPDESDTTTTDDALAE